MDGLLNIEAALANLDDDMDIWSAVAETYVETTPELLEDMKKSILLGDITTMTRHAHSMKSSSRTIGGMSVGDMAEDMETAGRNEDLNSFKSQFQDFEKAVTELCNEIRKVIE